MTLNQNYEKIHKEDILLQQSLQNLENKETDSLQQKLILVREEKIQAVNHLQEFNDKYLTLKEKFSLVLV